MTDVPFASNAIRLSPRAWAIALITIAAVFHFTPVLWERIEKLDPGPDYRIPYRLGSDYWFASRYTRLAAERSKVMVVGDSVVWGHYVSPQETLSHYLNELDGEDSFANLGGDSFANLGVDGIHPAALSGLIEHYARGVRAKSVILHCNLLWMSSQRHDLQSEKEFSFNHPRLVPQFFANIPCYEESSSERLGIVLERTFPFSGWARHLQIAYFDNADLSTWTIEHPYANPVAAVTLELPRPEEPPSPEPDARPWTEQGLRKFNPPWVELATSFQWDRFKRTVRTLQDRQNRVFVLLGPLNEHMLTERSLATYRDRKREVEAWLQAANIPHWVAPVLPSDEYADASHPLGPGYAQMAGQLLRSRPFIEFCSDRPSQ